MLRRILISLSRSPRAARLVMQNSIARRFARRFIAGERMDDAVAVAHALNAQGMQVTLDYLGEHVRDAYDSLKVYLQYRDVLDRIKSEHLNAHISVKLTQFGLDICESGCKALLDLLAQHAHRLGSFVRIDMENSEYTDRTLRIARELRAVTPAIGVVIQASLCRSLWDIESLISSGCGVRLCKGAYLEPEDAAYVRKSQVDANFVRLIKRMLSSHTHTAIATHDPRIIGQTIAFVSKHAVPIHQFEFQMLYGIRKDLQRKLADKGFRVRIYVPFGTEWFPYFMRRLAERPANLWFFLRHALMHTA